MMELDVLGILTHHKAVITDMNNKKKLKPSTKKQTDKNNQPSEKVSTKQKEKNLEIYTKKPIKQKNIIKSNIKKLLAGGALLSFVILAVSAVLISQKQKTEQPTINPRPQAKHTTTNCTLEFNVATSPTATIQVTNTPKVSASLTPTKVVSTANIPTQINTQTPTETIETTQTLTPTNSPTATNIPTNTLQPTKNATISQVNSLTATPTPVPPISGNMILTSVLAIGATILIFGALLILLI